MILRYAPDTRAHDAPKSRCGRECCWTPMGHSTVRDGLPTHHPGACHCHDKEKSR